jgi:DNA-binding NtrC family response regulator
MMTKPFAEKILVVDDDPTFQTITRSLLKDSGYAVEIAESAESGEQKLRQHAYDLILTDLVMAGVNGLAFLNFVKSWAPDTPVLMITGFASVDSAVEAMKAGAEDYLTKPCSSDELLLKIRRVLEKKRNYDELQRLREELAEKHAFGNIIGISDSMQAVFKLIARVAETDAAVLIEGETGTGKELVARAIHYNSPRKDKPFISVNCAALTETLLETELFGHERGAFTGAIKQKLGRFELAHQGTLFLDEVADISPATQAKLLRVLQEKEFERVGGTETIRVDIRILSATNKSLQEAIRASAFREDLYYRLNVMPIKLSPLRNRIEDIPLLAQHFIQKYSTRFGKVVKGFTSPALEILMRYRWPGNVRELENVMERAVIICNDSSVTPDCLVYLDHGKDVDVLKEVFQKQLTEVELTKLYARMVYHEQKGNKKETCKILGINFRTLQSRLQD